jgi:hypothetical protein
MKELIALFRHYCPWLFKNDQEALNYINLKLLDGDNWYGGKSRGLDFLKKEVRSYGYLFQEEHLKVILAKSYESYDWTKTRLKENNTWYVEKDEEKRVQWKKDLWANCVKEVVMQHYQRRPNPHGPHKSFYWILLSFISKYQHKDRPKPLTKEEKADSKDAAEHMAQEMFNFLGHSYTEAEYLDFEDRYFIPSPLTRKFFLKKVERARKKAHKDAA